MPNSGIFGHRHAGVAMELLTGMPPAMHAVHPAVAYVGAATPGTRIAKLITDFPVMHRHRKPGDYVFRAGDDFHCFHVLQTGFVKTCFVHEDGREQTMGFHLRGDILGLDAVATGSYGWDAVALDDCEVLAIPYDAVIAHSQHNPDVGFELHRAFSAEIRRDRDISLNQNRLLADGRVAAFLLEMSHRFASRGFSATEIQLRLTREEIGSMLGLKLETVSRAFSRFAKLELISVYLRDIVLLDRDGLLDIIAEQVGLDRNCRKSKSPSRSAHPA
jgi:CRP/FNR family transcriptional regulator